MGSTTVWQPLVMDQQWPAKVFDVQCTACPRLHAFHEQNRQKFPGHFNGPVPPFGPDNAELLIVGLAPGLHGANRLLWGFVVQHLAQVWLCQPACVDGCG